MAASTVKAYQVGTMVVYGAKTRDAMWRSLSRLLDMLEIECKREDLHVFLVVARANLKINVKEIKDMVINSLAKSYSVWYESTGEIPGIMLKKGNTTSSVVARIHMNGMMICEAESEKVAESVIIGCPRYNNQGNSRFCLNMNPILLCNDVNKERNEDGLWL